MKQLFFKTLFLLFFTIAISCINKNESEDQLPPITQTGANTFGCLIDGKVLLPKNGFGYPKPRGFEVGWSTNNTLIIDVGNYKDDVGGRIYIYIYIYIYNITSTGNYSLGIGKLESFFYPDYSYLWSITYDGVNNGKVLLSSLNSGIIKITRLDLTNQIISGTFNLSVINKNNPTETIEITEGRFDINLNTLNN